MAENWYQYTPWTRPGFDHCNPVVNHKRDLSDMAIVHEDHWSDSMGKGAIRVEPLDPKEIIAFDSLQPISTTAADNLVIEIAQAQDARSYP